MSNSHSEKIRRLAGRVCRPSRLGNWLRARRERRERPDTLRSLPLGIDLEPTTRCNLRCRACQQTEDGWVGEDLSLERLERVFDQLPYLEQIKLQGIGEPFLHEQFFEFVSRAKRRGIWVSSITNGTTLHREEHRRKTLESGLDELFVSIDGATAETHARWRGGSDLDQIASGMKRLVEQRGRARVPRLGIWCVANCDNIVELPALVEMASALGVEQLTYQTDLVAWGKEPWRARLVPFCLDLQSAETARLLNAAGKEAHRRKVDFTIYTGNRFSAQQPCFWPWESCFIGAGGHVTRCCIASDPRLHHFGQIGESDFAVLWNSRQYQAFRKAIRESEIPPLCRACYGMVG